MKRNKYWIVIGILVIFILIIRWFSSNALWVESYYSTGIYLYLSVFLRYLLGWLPFSIGDVLYGAIVIWFLYRLIKISKVVIHKEVSKARLMASIQRLVVTLLSIYILFNSLWGINYNRLGIASQLGLSMEKYSVNDLKTLNGVLLQKVNESNGLLLQKPVPEMTSSEIFNKAMLAYREVNKQYPFLNYHPASIKTSLWGWMGNYVGFLGYYNPFTGEGQVNTTVPKFSQPYTNCHEIAHQLGYAKENEANFVGYLAASASKEETFHYSVYLDLFLYANRNLFLADSVSAKAFTKELHPAVKKNLREWRQFNERHKNPVEPVIRWMYGKYLESNQQPSGVLSYNEVNSFLIAYYKKYGRL